MTQKDQIEIELKLMTQEAQASLKLVNESLRETENMIKSMKAVKGEDIIGSDVEKALHKVQQDMRKIGAARSSMLADVQNPNARNEASGKLSAQQLSQAVGQMDKEFDKVIGNMASGIAGLQTTSRTQSRMGSSRTKVPGGPRDPDNIYPDISDLQIRETQRDKQKVTSRATSSVTALERTARSGRATHNQAEVLRGHMEGTYFDSTGASPEDFEDVKKFAQGKGDITWESVIGSPLERAQERITGSGDKIQTLQGELSGLGSKISKGETAYSPEEFNELIMAQSKTREEIEKQKKIREDNKSLLTEIVDGINRVQTASEKFGEDTKESGVTVDSAPDSFMGILSSRSSAIAIAGATAGLYAFTKSLQEGKTVVENERPGSMAVGYGSGNYDFREIRKDARESGEGLGYRGVEMLEFSQSVMGSMGYTGETKGVTNELAKAERFSGTSDGTYTELFDSVLRSGGVDSESQARDLTDQIEGAIVSSGMTGRQDEQTTAMEALLSDQISGRAASNEEINSQLAIMSMFAGTGNKALQGENMQQNLGSLSEGIAGSSLFSDFSFFMGAGTDEEFMGAGGAHRLDMEKEKGLGSQYVLDGLNTMVEMMGEQEALDYMSNEQMFSGLSGDAREEIVAMAKSGNLNLETAEELAESDKATGADVTKEKEEAWEDSPDQTRLDNINYREQTKAAMDDSGWGDTFENIKNTVGKITSSSTGMSVASNIGGGVLTGMTSAITSSVLMAVGSKGIKGLGSKALGGLTQMMGGGETVMSGGFFSKMFGGLGTKAAGAAGTAGEAVSSVGGGISSMIGSLTPEIAGDLVKGGAYGKLAIDSLTGIYKVSQADNKKAEAASQVGKTAGGFGGAAGGALIGSLLGPLGTIAGGAIGGWLGGKGGQGVGDWAADKWLGGTDAQNAEDMTDEELLDIADSQQDLATTAEKAEIENLRADNIHEETNNLTTWEALIKDIREVLAIARQQNGIVGSMNGMGSGSGMGAGGELGAVGDGDYWTSTNIKQHDISKTSSELTAGDLDAWINEKAPKGSKMLGMGSAFMDAGNQHGVDPRMLVGLAGHESGWGTSKQAKQKNNFFGMNANTNSPGDAFGYKDGSEGINDAARRISDYYIAEGKNTLEKMGPKYAKDPNWAQGIANTMKGSEKHTSKSKGTMNVNTNVTIKGSGSNKEDGKKVAKYINTSIDRVYSNEYQRL